MPGRRLILDDGREVILGARTGGGSKNQTRYGELDDGRPVVVKIQANYGQLGIEERALRHLEQTSVPVPRLIGSGRSAAGEFFLVLSREPGVRARDPEGWARMGRALAGLGEVSIKDCPLLHISGAEFGIDHRRRLELVAAFLGSETSHRVELAVERLSASTRLIVTHGDPGSGNYLDDGDHGVILDWETATVSPFGLDAGRAAFIGLMDLGHTGIGDHLHTAFIDGYRRALGTRTLLGDELLQAGTIVAGLQFVHGRLLHPLRADRTPEMAAATLIQYLKDSGA